MTKTIATIPVSRQVYKARVAPVYREQAQREGSQLGAGLQGVRSLVAAHPFSISGSDLALLRGYFADDAALDGVSKGAAAYYRTLCQLANRGGEIFLGQEARAKQLVTGRNRGRRSESGHVSRKTVYNYETELADAGLIVIPARGDKKRGRTNGAIKGEYAGTPYRARGIKVIRLAPATIGKAWRHLRKTLWDLGRTFKSLYRPLTLHTGSSKTVRGSRATSQHKPVSLAEKARLAAARWFGHTSDTPHLCAAGVHTPFCSCLSSSKARPVILPAGRKFGPAYS